MNPKEKLKILLEKKGRGAYSQLAEYLGVPRSYITRWVKDEKYNFPYEYIQEISKFFNISPSYFIHDDDNTIPLTHYLPIIGEASCGVPTNHHFEDLEMYPVPAMLYKEGRYIVRAIGDSMLPKIREGDLVICDKNAYIDNGSIIHYTLNEEESGIKKLITDEEGNPIMLMPLNDKYAPIPLKKDDKLRMAKCVNVISSL